MKAFILAGGQGKRLRPYTYVIPKPLMPIGGKPILQLTLERLAKQGFKEATISLGYLGDMIVNVVDALKLPIKIEYTRENTPLGTAGALGLLENFESDIITMNGDLLTSFNFKKMHDFHRKNKAAATLGIFQRQVTIDYGVIKMDKKGRFEDYIEKPTYDFDISMGINIISPRAKKYISKNKYLDMPTLIKKMHKKGEKIMCYKENCKWLDIGREFDYKIALEEFENNKKEYL